MNGQNMNDGPPEYIQPLRKRSQIHRWLFLISFIFLAFGFYITMTNQSISRLITIFLALSPAFYAMIRSPFARSIYFGVIDEDDYDEFEIRFLHRSTKIAYCFLLITMMVFSIWMWIGTSTSNVVIPNTSDHWKFIIYAISFIGSMLPVAIAEWTIPFPPEGDEE